MGKHNTEQNGDAEQSVQQITDTQVNNIVDVLSDAVDEAINIAEGETDAELEARYIAESGTDEEEEPQTLNAPDIVQAAIEEEHQRLEELMPEPVASSPAISLPAVGEEFTAEQDAAVFAALSEFLTSLKDIIDGAHANFISALSEGDFLTWTLFDQPYVRGASDHEVCLGEFQDSDDEGSFRQRVLLDFEFGDIVLTAPERISEYDEEDEEEDIPTFQLEIPEEEE